MFLTFPPNFLWGTASSSHQNEGNNTNNQWWHFEQQPGSIRNGARSGLACDWWRNAEADFDRMAGIGINAHRLSIEWSRVEPEPGRFDHAALDRYRQMLSALIERGIRPVVALHHFSQPLWFHRGGGWTNPQSVAYFERYSRMVVRALHDLCDFWITLNEPLVYVGQTWFRGIWPGGRKDPRAALLAFRHQLFAHAAAYHAIHTVQPDAMAGYAKSVRLFTGKRPSHMLDRYAAGIKRYLFEHLWFMAAHDGRLRPPLSIFLAPNTYYHPLVDSTDFIGLNYYTRDLVRFVPNPLKLFGTEEFAADAEVSTTLESGRPYSQYAPDGLAQICHEVSQFGKPIYITENGLPDAADNQRPRWLVGHLAHLHRAIADGCDVRGYFHWTLVDNFEWNEGWALRFGLFELDPQTQQRTARPSADLYAQIIQHNGLPAAMRQLYS